MFNIEILDIIYYDIGIETPLQLTSAHSLNFYNISVVISVCITLHKFKYEVLCLQKAEGLGTVATHNKVIVVYLWPEENAIV